MKRKGLLGLRDVTLDEIVEIKDRALTDQSAVVEDRLRDRRDVVENVRRAHLVESQLRRLEDALGRELPERRDTLIDQLADVEIGQ